MRTDFFVAALETEAGERFVVLRPDELPRKFFVPSSAEEFLQTLKASALGENEFSDQLAQMGLGPDEIAHQFERARGSLDPVKGRISWERTTQVGFRNSFRQVVMRKTDYPGHGQFQRLYEVECEDCHHGYHRDGSEVHVTRCPRCQAV